MDNICHTLVGAALAQAGLKRRTRYGTATLLVGANLPDVDAFSYVWGGGVTALSARRGWTHGVLAMLVLPLLLTGLVVLWNRVARARAAGDAGPPMRPAQVALLAAISILTHPLLDSLNTYGMRWFMPFVNRWYYADGLFIVDPWIWAVLAAGVFLSTTGKGDGGTGRGSRRGWGGAPAVTALLVVGAYALAMAGSSLVMREAIVRELAAQGTPPVRVMVSPVPVNPFRRLVVIDDGQQYRFGTVDWLTRPVFSVEPHTVAVNADAPAARAAALTPEGRAFLGWARFPFFQVETSPQSYVVHMVDARYTVDRDAGFGAATVVVPRSGSAHAARDTMAPSRRSPPNTGTRTAASPAADSSQTPAAARL